MEPGPSVFPTGLPPRQQLPHACFYPLSSCPWPSGPLQVPGRAALSLAQVLAPVLWPGFGPPPMAPTQTTQSQGLAEPAASAPRLASHGLSPPKRLWPGNH